MLTIYKASAGSGKTFTLAKEYIHALLFYKRITPAHGSEPEKVTYHLRPPGHKAHRSILAITFSVKATDEMKTRIIKELAAMADPAKPSKYRDDFSKDHGYTVEEIAAAASGALHNLLFDFSLFNVSTIDSFFQTVLRSFAREIDLTGNYEVELDENQAVKQGVGDMFASLNFDNGPDGRRLQHWLMLYMKQRIDCGGNFNMLNRGSSLHSKLVSTISRIMNEDFRLHSDIIQAYFDDPERIIKFERQLREAQKSNRQRFISNATAATAAVERYGALDAKIVAKDVMSKVTSWAAGKMPANLKELGLTVPAAATNEKKRYYADFLKKSAPPVELDSALVAMCAEAQELVERNIYYDALLLNLYVFGLLGYILRFIARYRQDNNLILISDTNELLRRVIRDDLTPFVYERLGYFLHHYLIDEFQDTSKMQWANLMPLILESLSNRNDNLIIGDEKQCIYRFRNSDPALLASQVEADIATHKQGPINKRGIDVSDNTNWRSAPEVVRFNNSIFPAIATTCGASATYANTIQQIAPDNESMPGYVDLEAFDASKIADFDELTLDRMARHIKRQLASGYRPKDIAVLVRTHYEGEKVINYLLTLMNEPEEDFPRFEITSREAMRVSSSPIVKLIISVLRLVDSSDATNSDRRVSTRALAQMINRFEYYFNNEGMAPDQALKRALTSDKELTDLMADDQSSLDSYSLPALVERVIDTFISKRQLEEHNIFISAFQDMVIDFCSRGLTDVRSFLQWWDDKGRRVSLSTPDDLDAVTVITVHASKGLQYRCVHVPYATWPLASTSGGDKQSFGWFDLKSIPGVDDECIPRMMPLELRSSLQTTPIGDQFDRFMAQQRVDNLNILYVAFTRAEQELIVSVAPKLSSKENVGNYITTALKRAIGDGSPWTTDLASRFNGTSITLGHPTTKYIKPKQGSHDDQPEVKPMPPYHTSRIPDACQITQVEDLIDLEQARQRGTFLHDVLSGVRRSADLPIALRRRAYRIGLSAEESEMYLNELREAIADPRVKRWFDGAAKVINERAIYCDGTPIRPDRVIWTPEGDIEVIDYKFGEPHAAHLTQVKGYMAKLSELHPEAEVRGYIWYIETGDIVTL